MGKVSEKILHDAKKEAEIIIEKAKKEAEKVISNANEKREKMLKDANVKKEKIVKEEKERKKIFEEIEENRLILMKKKEILDAVFENIRKNMLSWSEKKYIDFIMKNITSCINNEKDEIAIGKMHSKSLRKALEKYSKNKGLKFNLLEKDGDFEFGFIVNQKRIQKRFTIDDIIEEIRENKETMIVEEIFGKGS